MFPLPPLRGGTFVPGCGTVVPDGCPLVPLGAVFEAGGTFLLLAVGGLNNDLISGWPRTALPSLLLVEGGSTAVVFLPLFWPKPSGSFTLVKFPPQELLCSPHHLNSENFIDENVNCVTKYDHWRADDLFKRGRREPARKESQIGNPFKKINWL